MSINPSEMLRKLADIIDSMTNDATPGGSGTELKQNSGSELSPVEVSNDDMSDPNTMVSPLQQKFEMDKEDHGEKVGDAQPDGGVEVSVSSAEGETDESKHTCDQCGKEVCECDDNEMGIMKRNAGVPGAPTENKAPEEPVKEEAEPVVEDEMAAMRRIAGLPPR